MQGTSHQNDRRDIFNVFDPKSQVPTFSFPPISLTILGDFKKKQTERRKKKAGSSGWFLCTLKATFWVISPASELNKMCLFRVPCGEKGGNEGNVFCLMVPQFISMFFWAERLQTDPAAWVQCLRCAIFVSYALKWCPNKILGEWHSPAELLSTSQESVSSHKLKRTAPEK